MLDSDVWLYCYKPEYRVVEFDLAVYGALQQAVISGGMFVQQMHTD